MHVGDATPYRGGSLLRQKKCTEQIGTWKKYGDGYVAASGYPYATSGSIGKRREK